MKFNPPFNQRNFFFKPEKLKDIDSSLPVAYENFSNGTTDQNLLNIHGLLFSPSAKIIKNTDNGLFFCCVTFNSLKGCQIKTINLKYKSGLIAFDFDIDTSNIDFTQFCSSELIIDINKIDFLVKTLQNNIRINYMVTINNPLSFTGIKERNNSLFAGSNSTGGTTDPFEEVPFV